HAMLRRAPSFARPRPAASSLTGPPTTTISSLSLHELFRSRCVRGALCGNCNTYLVAGYESMPEAARTWPEMNEYLKMRPIELLRSEEHTSELQSRENIVCRLLLEKKKYENRRPHCQNSTTL